MYRYLLLFFITISSLMSFQLQHEGTVQGDVIAIGDSLNQSTIESNRYEDEDYDLDTFNSVKNKLILPDLKSVKYARLYWWGSKKNSRSKIGFKFSENQSYKYLSNEKVDMEKEYYLASKDVTSAFQNIDDEVELYITITGVKDYVATIDRGWSLVIAFDKEGVEESKEFKVYDGLVYKNWGNEILNIVSASNSLRNLKMKSLGRNNFFGGKNINIEETNTNIPPKEKSGLLIYDNKVKATFKIDKPRFIPILALYTGTLKKAPEKEAEDGKQGKKSGIFAEVGVGYVTANLESSWDSTLMDTSIEAESTSNYIVSFGYKFENQIKTDLTYDLHQYNGGKTSFIFVNGRFPFESMMFYGFTPYFSAGIGQGELAIDFLKNKISGMGYTGGIGAERVIFSNYTLNLGAKFISSSLEGEETIGGQTQTIKYNGYTNIFMSVGF
jgi:hypothetical protein